MTLKKIRIISLSLVGAGALGDVDIVIPYADIVEYMSEDALSLIGYEKN